MFILLIKNNEKAINTINKQLIHLFLSFIKQKSPVEGWKIANSSIHDFKNFTCIVPEIIDVGMPKSTSLVTPLKALSTNSDMTKI